MKTTERLELVPVDQLIGYARNARVHSPEQIAQLRASLREYGFVNPILADKDLNVIAGHGRLMAAREEGIAEVPCVFVEHLTETQKKPYILADNRTALSASWDDDLLRIELEELQELDFNVELTGFTDAEVSKLFANGEQDIQDDDFDLTAALEEAAFVLPGDAWSLGRHRLICGDATDADTVIQLMDGRKANLVLTDPPYAVSYKSASGLSIKNDRMKPEEFFNFLLLSFRNLAENLENDGSAYIFHADTEGENFRRAFREAGFHLSGTCIWVKNAPVLGRSPFLWQHEPLLYGWKKIGKHQWYKGRAEKTVWNFDKPTKNQHHPTVKPIDLLAYPITCSTQANGIVLDTFGGSGSTIVACEQTDRICRMLEIDPKYASVILRRFAELKQNGGVDITCERSGQTFHYADLVKEVKRK